MVRIIRVEYLLAWACYCIHKSQMLSESNPGRSSTPSRQETESCWGQADPTLPYPDHNNPAYFMNFIWNPRLIEYPNQTKVKLSSHMWIDKEIKSVRLLANYLEVTINHKRSMKKAGKKSEVPLEPKQEPKFDDKQFEGELEIYKNYVSQNYGHFLVSIACRKDYSDIAEFNEYVNSLGEQRFLAFFMPLRDEGPAMRRMVISKSALEMLKYDAHEFSFEVDKFTQLATDFWRNDIYKIIFINYIKSFRRYMECELSGRLTLEECASQSIIRFTNELRGKNNETIRVQTRMLMPNMNTICYVYERILGRNESRHEEFQEVRNSLLTKANQATFNSLSSITRLPKEINPANNNKICSYTEVLPAPGCPESDKSEPPSH